MAAESVRLNEPLNLRPDPLEANLSLMHDGPLVAAFASLVKTVRNPKNCLSEPLGQGAAKEAAELGRCVWIQALGGLVQKEDSRIGQECTRQSKPLLHSL